MGAGGVFLLGILLWGVRPGKNRWCEEVHAVGEFLMVAAVTHHVGLVWVPGGLWPW